MVDTNFVFFSPLLCVLCCLPLLLPLPLPLSFPFPFPFPFPLFPFPQLSCGSLPLTSSDPLELIHRILAKSPVAPHVLKPSIPVILSEIIMKLLSKNPEARYQSAWGVKADLAKCLRNCLKEKQKQMMQIDKAMGQQQGEEKGRGGGGGSAPFEPTDAQVEAAGEDGTATPRAGFGLPQTPRFGGPRGGGQEDTVSQSSGSSTGGSGCQSGGGGAGGGARSGGNKDEEASSSTAGSATSGTDSDRFARKAREGPEALPELSLSMLDQDLIDCAGPTLPGSATTRGATTPGSSATTAAATSGAAASGSQRSGPYDNVPSFVLARYDVYSKLNISEKLYGRNKEVATLQQAFDEMSTSSHLRIVAVSGLGGSGKSSLVRSVVGSLCPSHRRALFASSKLDQFKRTIPYDAFLLALSEVVMEILSKSTARVRKWEKKIMSALGVNAGLMTDILPALKQIVGEQPNANANANASSLSTSALQVQTDGGAGGNGGGENQMQPNSAEAVHRLQIVFCRLICAFASKRRPLVLFFDDCQWADSSSLKLLHLLATDSSSHHILLILSYRIEDPDSLTPLLDILTAIAAAGTQVKHLPLAPLTVKHINDLLCDTFHPSDPSRTLSLAGFIAAKSGGNAFFIHQILRALHANKFLKFSPLVGDATTRDGAGGGEWQWDETALQHAELGASVTDLIAKKLATLPQQSQRVLKLAACIGARFDLETLSIISELPRASTQAALMDALKEELIMQHSTVLPVANAGNKKSAAVAGADGIIAPTPLTASQTPTVAARVLGAASSSSSRDDPPPVPKLQSPPLRRGASSPEVSNDSSGRAVPPERPESTGTNDSGVTALSNTTEDDAALLDAASHESTARMIERRQRVSKAERTQFQREQEQRTLVADHITQALQGAGPDVHVPSAHDPATAVTSRSSTSAAYAPSASPDAVASATAVTTVAAPISVQRGRSDDTMQQAQQGSGEAVYTEVTYAWLHDRVQQAAYNLIEQDLREQTHVHIGTLLLNSMRAHAARKYQQQQQSLPSSFASSSVQATPLTSDSSKLFDLVSHFNVGLRLVLAMSNEWRVSVAEINLAAARKAKASASYSSSMEYCRAGMLLMGFESIGGAGGSGSGSAGSMSKQQATANNSSQQQGGGSTPPDAIAAAAALADKDDKLAGTPAAASAPVTAPKKPGSTHSGSSATGKSSCSSSASSAAEAATLAIADLSVSGSCVPLAGGAGVAWDQYYALCYDLYSERAALELLCGNPLLAEGYLRKAMQQARTVPDKVGLLQRMNHQRTSAGEYSGAIACGIQALQLLHVNFKDPSIPTTLPASASSSATSQRERGASNSPLTAGVSYARVGSPSTSPTPSPALSTVAVAGTPTASPPLPSSSPLLGSPTFDELQGIVTENAATGFSTAASSWYNAGSGDMGSPSANTHSVAAGVRSSAGGSGSDISASSTSNGGLIDGTAGVVSQSHEDPELVPSSVLVASVADLVPASSASGKADGTAAAEFTPVIVHASSSPLYNVTPIVPPSNSPGTDRATPSASPPLDERGGLQPARSSIASNSNITGGGTANTFLLLEQVSEKSLRAHYQLFKHRLREYNHRMAAIHDVMQSQLQSAQGGPSTVAPLPLAAHNSSSVRSLLDLPRMTSGHERLIALTYASLIAPAWVAHQPLLRLIVFKAALHALEYGLAGCEHTPFLMLGLILLSDFGEVERGSELAGLSFQLCDKFASAALSDSAAGAGGAAGGGSNQSAPSHQDRAKLCALHAGLLHHWQRPLESALPLIDSSLHLSLSSGDISIAGWALIFQINAFFYTGRPLDTLYADVCKAKVSNARILNNQLTSDFLQGIEMILLNLNGYNHYSSEFELVAASAAEVAFMQRVEKSASGGLALACFLIFRAHMLYLYGQPWLALQCLSHAQSKLVYLTGWINHAYFCFLHSLCQLALLTKNPPTNNEDHTPPPMPMPAPAMEGKSGAGTADSSTLAAASSMNAAAKQEESASSLSSDTFHSAGTCCCACH